MPADSTAAERGLLDTSIFIARESGRPLGALPESASISVITIAELHLGVLMASSAAIRSRRLRTLTMVQSIFDPLVIDSAVAGIFAEIVSEARRKDRRPKIMHTWIAATAIANALPIYTQDEDFLAIPRARVIRV
jgi:predicted nucleic acid-binding protein